MVGYLIIALNVMGQELNNMSYAEKFRPQKPNQLVGKTQVDIAKYLLSLIDKGDILHELLFTGPSGVGKTTIARMYAQAVLGGDENLDNKIRLISCSAETGIDNIRSVIEELSYLPLHDSYRIYFLDEIHGLSKQAQNALLNAIEPLPPHVIMIAATTDPDKLIKTLRSRFTEFKLKSPSQDDFRKLASWIIKAENGSAPKEVDLNKVSNVIDSSGGNIRVFVRNMESFLNGGVTEFGDIDENGDGLFQEVFFKNSTLSSWFQIASKEQNYNGLAVQLTKASITMIRNNKANPNTLRKAQIVLDILGDGLSSQMPEDVSFHSKLLKIYNKVNNK